MPVGRSETFTRSSTAGLTEYGAQAIQSVWRVGHITDDDSVRWDSPTSTYPDLRYTISVSLWAGTVAIGPFVWLVLELLAVKSANPDKEGI